MLDELGLNASLEWQCKEFSALNGIPCVFEQAFDDEDLSNEIKTELFRICQESLTNVMRHAAATHVQVSINDTAEGLHLSINDNGKGFDVKQHSNTLGLIGMRERVLSINGKLSVVSQPGKGTTISAAISKKMIHI
jgi:signal transduction histidine kinase